MQADYQALNLYLRVYVNNCCLCGNFAPQFVPAGTIWVLSMPIIEPNSLNPFIDGRQSINALMIRQGVERHFRKLGYSCLAELTLASGRRCDLICLSSKGKFVIVEVKSSVEDFRVDNKWPEYRQYCDSFYFATHFGVPAEIFPQNTGLIVADTYGAEIIREAKPTSISAASRKALLLRYARVATQRLNQVSYYAEKAGFEVDFTNGD